MFKKPPPGRPQTPGRSPISPLRQTLRPDKVGPGQKTDIIWLLVLLGGVLTAVSSPFVAAYMSQAYCHAWYTAAGEAGARAQDFYALEAVLKMMVAHQCPVHTIVSAWPQALLGFGGIGLGAILHALRRSRREG